MLQIRPGRLQGHVEPHGVSPTEAIDHRLGRVVDPHLLLHDAMGFDALPETGTGIEDGPDRRIGDLGSAGLPLHGEPDFMGDLGGQAVEGKGGDEADDAMGGELGHVDEIDFRGETLHLGQLIKAPGGGNQRTVFAKAVQGSPVDPLTKGLAGADDPSLLRMISMAFVFAVSMGDMVQKRRQNVKSADAWQVFENPLLVKLDDRAD